MRKLSAGILIYRYRGQSLEVFLVHPGGPLWKNKDLGSWSLPKGEYSQEENAFEAAKREFREETGFAPPEGEYTPLGEIRQPSGKVVTAWAVEGDCPAEEIQSNTFPMEWPPKSRRMQQFPEVDRAEWFPFAVAKAKIPPGQAGFLERLASHLGYAEKPSVSY
jgi:predicted NUDIX family NTP pyrophosphohydrolase